ncbi:MAG: hypothetical protein FWD30_02205 [Dehalococcoidia bacterium]|nr:hypothetical protein [Dehalococcoidia bacterium]
MEKTSSGLQENVAGLLCYIFWIASIFFLLTEKENKTVRFHAIQSLCLYVAAIAISIVISILNVIFMAINASLGFISMLLWFVFGFGIFIIWVLLIIRTYQSKLWQLPIIGNMAAKWAGI